MGWSRHYSGLSFPERKKDHIGGSQGNIGGMAEPRGWPKKRRLLPSSKRHECITMGIAASVGLAPGQPCVWYRRSITRILWGKR